MAMFCYLANKLSCLCVVYPGYVVHATNDKVDSIWRPSQVVDLCSRGAAHMLYSPCLLVLERIFAKCGLVVQFGWNPQQDVSIITCRGKNLTPWCKSYNIDRLIMLAQGRQVLDRTIFAILFDPPESDVVVASSCC